LNLRESETLIHISFNPFPSLLIVVRAVTGEINSFFFYYFLSIIIFSLFLHLFISFFLFGQQRCCPTIESIPTPRNLSDHGPQRDRIPYVATATATRRGLSGQLSESTAVPLLSKRNSSLPPAKDSLSSATATFFWCYAHAGWRSRWSYDAVGFPPTLWYVAPLLI
jgi:hypothetical protein